jgi:hypothetical protein
MAESAQKPTEQNESFFIIGQTSNGRQFRPSDWAERLCGVMACFKPEGYGGGRDSHLGYSPYVTPTVVNGVKSVVVNGKLRALEPLAYHFVLSFAKDNDLQVADACPMPER